MNTAQPPQAEAAPTLQQRVRSFVERPAVQRVVMWLIVINAVVLGLETSASVMAAIGPQLRALDQALLAVFVVEIALRLYAHRSAFFRDPWSVFDLLVVGIALLPATGPLAVLRALRVLRVLRLLTIVPSMRRVVGALLSAIPGLMSIAGVLAILFYVFGVVATKLFGPSFPEWFGTLGASLYTLFQVMTLESWSMGIARPVMETHPQAWMFFVPFILIATFTMLNLFIAIIVSAMQSFNEEEAARTRETVDASREHIENDLHAEMQRLREQIAELRTVLSSQMAASPATGVPPGSSATQPPR